MMSIHNYVQYRCNINPRYSRMHCIVRKQGGRYLNLSFKRRMSVSVHSILKENVRYTSCESQYWMGCA